MVAIPPESSSESFDRAIGVVAAKHHGVFRRADAVAAGASAAMIKHRLDSGRWQLMHRAVYRLAGTPGSFRQSLAATVLAGGDSAAASHRSAAALRGLPRVGAEVVEITVRSGRRLRSDGVVVHESKDLSRADVSPVDGIPATTLPRTLIDLAAVVEAEVVEEALDHALRVERMSLAWLEWRVAELRRSGRPGIALIERLVGERRGRRTDSPLEDLALAVIRNAGLPMPVCQYEVRGASGRLVGRVDFAYPDARLAIEADSFEWHSVRTRWGRDLVRGNELLAVGWRVIHLTKTDVDERPGRVAEVIATALAASA